MRLQLEMLRQPTDSSCGPTCLHAVYRYFGLEYDLLQLIEEVGELEGGGTLSVQLGHHALERGFSARIITYNLNVFDPVWCKLDVTEVVARLDQRIAHLSDDKAIAVHHAYIDFLRLGGGINFFDLTPDSLSRLLLQQAPVLTGLSASYLYQSSREMPDGRADDIAGQPTGHFVVATGWDNSAHEVTVVDPFGRNPFHPDGEYRVDVHRFINSVMLGIVTYDANLLVISRSAAPSAAPQ